MKRARRAAKRRSLHTRSAVQCFIHIRVCASTLLYSNARAFRTSGSACHDVKHNYNVYLPVIKFPVRIPLYILSYRTYVLQHKKKKRKEGQKIFKIFQIQRSPSRKSDLLPASNWLEIFVIDQILDSLGDSCFASNWRINLISFQLVSNQTFSFVKQLSSLDSTLYNIILYQHNITIFLYKSNVELVFQKVKSFYVQIHSLLR